MIYNGSPWYRLPKMTRSTAFIFLAGMFLLSGGCETTPPIHKSAKATWQAFTDEIQDENFSKAYRYLSADTRERYKLNEFHGLLKKTRAGRLLRWKLNNWTIRDVQTRGPDRAFVILASPDGERQNRYELVRTTTDQGKHSWRIRYYIADEMNIPRRDEDMLFNRTEEQ